MLRRLLMAVGVAAAGCGGEDAGCKPLRGIYEVRLTETEGECLGDTVEQVLIGDGESLAADTDACDRDGVESADGCSIQFEQECRYQDAEGELGTLETIGTLELARDGSSASGNWRVQAHDARTGERCTSAAEVTYELLEPP